MFFRRPLPLALLLLSGGIVSAQTIPNWTAPTTWAPPAKGHGAITTLDLTPPLPFMALAPCRIADTRAGSGFPAGYGPPSLSGGSTRTFDLAGQCGIPAGAGAVSLNITVTNTAGPGFIKIYPAGSLAPLVSTLNYVAGQTIANAAVVPLGAGGGVNVFAGVSGTDLIIDTNGYYAAAPGSISTTFTITTSSIGGPVPAILGQNLSTSCQYDCGVEGATSSTSNGYGVSGRAFGTSGVNYGVFGRTYSNSNDTAGVFGLDKTGPTVTTYQSAGVRGESFTNYGVLGISTAFLLYTGAGVAGSAVGTDGTEFAYGILAGVIPTNVYGVFAGGDFGGTGAKYFIEPHPTDASKVIRYVSLEGPEAGTYFRGRGRFENGLATIDVPEDFRLVTDTEGLSVQVTPIGELASVAVVRIGLDGIVVKASRDVEFFYTVNGVRKTHKHLTPIGPGTEFMPRSADAKMPGYLTEGQKAILISNGTYREDGTVNLETARRLGWDRVWEERQRLARHAAEEARGKEALR